jgi:hypothetical protein
MLKRFLAFAVWVLITDYCFSQSDSTANFKVSGYLETYYSYDFLKPTKTPKPDYNYNYKNHNQLSVNLAFVKANYTSKKFRSNLALMVGPNPCLKGMLDLNLLSSTIFGLMLV